MRIGVPREVKNHEYRIGLTPASVKEYVAHGHEVIVENNAAKEIGFLNEHYTEAGAAIAESASEIFEIADMIIKVKEPLKGAKTPLVLSSSPLVHMMQPAEDRF